MTGKLAGGGVDKPGQSAAPGALCTRSDRHALSSSMGHDLLERLSSPCRKNKLSSVEPAKCQPGWGLLPNATGCQPQPTYKAQLRRSLKCSPSTVAAMARLAAARPWPLGLDQWVHGRPVPGQFYKAWLGNDSEALKPCNQMVRMVPVIPPSVATGRLASTSSGQTRWQTASPTYSSTQAFGAAACCRHYSPPPELARALGRQRARLALAAP